MLLYKVKPMNEQEPKRGPGRKEGHTTYLLTVICDYGILKSANNFIVAERTKTPENKDKPNVEDFLHTHHSYYSTDESAYYAIYRRLLEGKLKKRCENYPIELKEIIELIKNHQKEFEEILKNTKSIPLVVK